jgi:catalase
MTTRPSTTPRGPAVLYDSYVVPKRTTHAKGTGAHGFFEVTRDVSDLTCADFLSDVGNRTPVFAHFSTVAGRKPRGFALRFQTDAGDYDVVGNHTPVFSTRDASKPLSRELRTNDAQWDSWTLSPESAHQLTILMSDRGVPRTLRHMHGYGAHVYSCVIGAGERFWVKYHFKTVQGIANFNLLEADAMAACDPDYHRRDLWTALAAGDSPEWRLEVQIMPFEDAADYRFNPFDATKVWPHADYPPILVGRIVLERNSAEAEQATFSPANLVEGIALTQDGRNPYERHADDDDFIQPRALYRDVMDDTARERLALNIAAHASDGVSRGVQRRVVGYWEHVDPVLGARVAAALARV